MGKSLVSCFFDLRCSSETLQDGPKKWSQRLMTIILSNLNRFKHFSLEDFLANLQLNGY